jgi:type VI secretion system protein ImpH
MGHPDDALNAPAPVVDAPWSIDFHGTLRWIDARGAAPRIGRSRRPAEDPVRFSQVPSLAFQPAPVRRLQRDPDGALGMTVDVLGLGGPDGPLPLHLTELAHERILHRRDSALAAFLDIVNGRFIAYFHRAWAQAQPTASADRPGDDHFARQLGALAGQGGPHPPRLARSMRHARLHFAGLLGREVRNADGLAAMLKSYFGAPVTIRENAVRWVAIPAADRTRPGVPAGHACLGEGAVLGDRYPDATQRVEIVIGPLDLRRFESLLPGSGALTELGQWVGAYAGGEIAWSVRLLLAAREVPSVRLGMSGRVGRTAWLGTRRTAAPAGDLVIDESSARTA